MDDVIEDGLPPDERASGTQVEREDKREREREMGGGGGGRGRRAPTPRWGGGRGVFGG